MAGTPTILLGDAFLPLLDGTLRDRFVLFEGPRGTGKTRAILTVILCRALAHPGSRWILGRSTRTRLSTSVLKTLEEQVFPAFGMSVPGGAGVHNRSEYVLPNGSQLVPMGLDDASRTQSVECAGLYLAEAVEIARADDATALAGAMRQAVPGLAFHQAIVDCNPGPPGHWLNRIAEPVPRHWRRVNGLADYRRLLDHGRKPAPPGAWKRVVTRHQDNPAYFDVRRWQWTPAGAAYLGGLGYLTGHLRRRWLDGDWVSAEGTVYPEFDEARHVVRPFRVPDDWPVYCWWDPGYDHPTAIVWVAIAPNGCYYIFDEIYRGGLGVADHCRNVRERNAGRTVRRYYADPQHAFSQTAQSPKSIAAQAREAGIVLVPGPRSIDVEAGVNGVRQRLIDDRLKVFATCRHTVDEFQSWRYRRNARGEQLAGDDQFEDADNHAMDGVRGLVTLNLKPLGQAGVRVEAEG
jgi:hypothetical protein